MAARGWRAHIAVAALAGALTYMFWRSRMEWVSDMRLWRAVGDASLVLLVIALAAGPAAILWRPAARLLAWRRALGIWSALAAALHFYLVWDGWARWSTRRLFGYEDLSAAGGPDNVLTDPGFGLSNLVGLLALVWLLVLAAVSSDWAVQRLGARAWRHLQQYAYVAFYLVGLHAAYFLFMHYDLSLSSLVFRKAVPEPNWFRAWFVAAFVLVVVLQVAAFARVVRRRRQRRGAMDDGQVPDAG